MGFYHHYIFPRVLDLAMSSRMLHRPRRRTLAHARGRILEFGFSLSILTDSVHRHGALAGAELAHGGFAVANRYTREVPLAPSPIPNRRDPWQARAMDRADIKAYRGWHKRAALQAKKAGFDIVFVYAADDLELLQFFLSRRRNPAPTNMAARSKTARGCCAR